MKPRGHWIFLIVVLAFSLLLVGVGLSMPHATSRTLPVLVGGIVTVLAAVELVRTLRGGRAPESQGEEQTAGRSARGYLMAILWFGGFFVVVYLFGFIPATALFAFLYMKVYGGRWLSSIAYSVVTTGAIWLVFQYLMKTTLYRGVLVEMLF